MATRPIIFGELEGIEEGAWFAGRREMMPSGFHRSWGRGIDGNGLMQRLLLSMPFTTIRS